MTMIATAPKARPYSVLNALDATAFLRPEDFRTEYDARQPEYAREQYGKGYKLASWAHCIYITCGSTWAASYVQGVVTSYEGIGYHACTADLLRGFLDGDAPIRVHRYGSDSKHGILIKPRAWSRACAHCGERVRWHGDEFRGDWVDQRDLSICDASGRKHDPHSPA